MMPIFKLDDRREILIASPTPRSFAELKGSVGVFRSIEELEDAVFEFVAYTNANQMPFLSTKPNKIIAAFRRGHLVLDSIC